MTFHVIVTQQKQSVQNEVTHLTVLM